MKKLVVAVLFVLCAVLLQTQSAAQVPSSMVLTNATVTDMCKAGMKSADIIETIGTHRTNFNTALNVLVAMEKFCPRDVVIAMSLKSQMQGAAIAPAQESTQVTARTVTQPLPLAKADGPITITSIMKIEHRTPVKLIVDELLSSKSATVGDPVRLVVADDVTASGTVVIAKGSAATGRVTEVKKRKIPKSDGLLVITVDSVKSIDEQNIPIEGTLREGGEGTSFGSIGRHAEVKKGAPVAVSTVGEKTVNVKSLAQIAAND